MVRPFESLISEQEEAMQLEADTRGPRHPVENGGTEATPLGGIDWAVIQQQQVTESDQLFCKLADQQRAAINQVMAGQAAMNQQL